MKLPRGENLSNTSERKLPLRLLIAKLLGQTALSGWIVSYAFGGTLNAFQDQEQPFNPAYATQTALLGYEKIYNEITGTDICPSGPSTEELLQYVDADYSWPEEFQSLEGLAKSFNLTLANYEHVMDKKESIQSSETPEEIVQALNQFTEQEYQPTIRLSGFEEYPDQMPEMTILRGQAVNFLYTLAKTPKEVFNVVDLDAIEIRPYSNERGALGGLEYTSEYAVVIIDIHNLYNQRVFSHELLGHAIHRQVLKNSGLELQTDSSTDCVLSRHNPASASYASELPDPNVIKTNDGIFDPNVFVNNYAQDSPGEDTADTTKLILSGGFEITKDNIDDPVGKKAATVMYRIDDVVGPGAASYLATVFREVY